MTDSAISSGTFIRRLHGDMNRRSQLTEVPEAALRTVTEFLQYASRVSTGSGVGPPKVMRAQELDKPCIDNAASSGPPSAVLETTSNLSNIVNSLNLM